MNNDMKCPFCGEKLEPYYGYGIELYSCSNLTCKGTDMKAEDSVWQELIRTRKALDLAKNAINSAADHNIINCVARGIDPRTDDTNVTLCNALEQITALEQKDK